MFIGVCSKRFQQEQKLRFDFIKGKCKYSLQIYLFFGQKLDQVSILSQWTCPLDYSHSSILQSNCTLRL